jgi:hypothetical protein
VGALEVKAIAAFPWITCKEPIEVGSVRILPYLRALAPGDSQHAKQADLDAILGAYADHPNQIVKRASLLEVDDYRTGMDAGAHAYRLFGARELIAFAALAKRRLFRQHLEYCNHHTYELIVQRYESGKGDRFVFSSRRRDGTVGHQWASDKFAHHRPNHVYGHATCDLDRPLLAALLKLEDGSRLREAIREFNSANTDSDDVPEHVEVVMVKSAFEWLLDIDHLEDSFVEALDALLGAVLGPATVEGPMQERWHKRWSRARRPLEAWARDFCGVRGAAAHGERRPVARYVWPAHTHLAFASIFFPLALKKRLADDSLLTLDETDHDHLHHIEQLLMVDPFSGESLRLIDEHAHPWAEIHYELIFNKLARRLAREDERPPMDEGSNVPSAKKADTP